MRFLNRAWHFLAFTALAATTVSTYSAAEERNAAEGADTNTMAVEFETPKFRLRLDPESHNVMALEPKGVDEKWEGRSFDFTPADQRGARNENGYHHLGDMTLVTRTAGSGDWKTFDSSARRQPVEPLERDGVLAAADLSATFGDACPLQVVRTWQEDKDGSLVMQVELANNGESAVTVGGLEFPAVFNNMIFDFTKKRPRSLEEAHAVCSFVDPYVGQDAGYLQVSRLTGTGQVLLVVPSDQHATPLEAFRPVRDRSALGQTFEGICSWVVYSQAWKETEWQEATPWNEPTSVTLEPGQTVTHALRFLLADDLRGVDRKLRDAGQPVALGVPGYIVPMDQDVQLFLDPAGRSVKSITSSPADALAIDRGKPNDSGWTPIGIRGQKWGRSRLDVTYEDGSKQSVHYYVTKPFAEAFGDLGNFLFTRQWFDDADDPFNRAPSIITYDREHDRQVTQETRVWFAGLSDEAGSGSYVAGTMKQLGLPDREQAAKLARFVDETVWGGIQFDEGPRKYGVKKSMFYYEPELLPDFEYIEGNWTSWTSWNKEHANDTGRSYNYPHVAAAHWTMYRLLRNHPGLIDTSQHEWDWYLDKAFNTTKFLGGGFDIGVGWRDMGLMEGSVFKHILDDLRREGWNEKADEIEALMRKRAEHWNSLEYPYGSEMAWDSTGQEEVYTWCRHFDYDDKAQVTLNAILAYMPTVPHWGYNGNARRYWDFIYGGAPGQGIERQIHHYGSGLNSIPVLDAFRRNPDDFYLLRVGYGGSSGALSAIDQEGFAACAFHSNPARLEWDTYSGDNGPNFFGHATTVGSYLVEHPDLGWLGFGGSVSDGEEGGVTLTPYDTFRQRVYLAPLGLYLTLDAGRFESVHYDPKTGAVKLTLDAAEEFTPSAVLRIEQPADLDGARNYMPNGEFQQQRGAWVIPLEEGAKSVMLRTAEKSVSKPASPASRPPYRGTIYVAPEIYRDSDPSAFESLKYVGRGERKMFDRREDRSVTNNAHLFEAKFAGGLSLEVRANSEFPRQRAEELARQYMKAFGQLPTKLRRDMESFDIHDGDRPFGGGGRGVLVHVGMGDRYIEDGILTETLFHETVHATIDDSLRSDPEWLAAQDADPAFISNYAEENPRREDLAETLLLAFAADQRPERLPGSMNSVLQATIPHRLKFFKQRLGWSADPTASAATSTPDKGASPSKQS